MAHPEGNGRIVWGRPFRCNQTLENIFESAELQEDSVRAKFAHTAADGKTYKTSFYNLDAIISVGYRVNSQKATRFRQWATKILNEYIRKGFVLDDEKLQRLWEWHLDAPLIEEG